jgi:putative ABC transport system permease protein
VNSLATATSLAWAYLRQRPLATLLNVLLLSLGVGTIIALILTLAQAEERMERDTAGIDLVIGAKGSPLQLVLSSVFQMDVPTGNVPLTEATPIITAPQVKLAIPLALGDSYKTFRIVGTEASYAGLYGATLQEGRLWTKPLEAVIGAETARTTGLKLGQNFAGSHGLADGGGAHADYPYIVVGVLKPTGSVVDRLILTSVESVWAVHEHADEADETNKRDDKLKSEHAKGLEKGHDKDHDHGKQSDKNKVDEHDHEHDAEKEITAYLIQYTTPLAAASFPRMVNESSSMQAASPAIETSRLFALLGLGVTTLKIFASIMMVCAALGIFIGLMNTLNERREDLALLRLLGATPTVIFFTVALQGAALGVLGVILGLLLGHFGAEWMGYAVQRTHRIQLTGWAFFKEEAVVVGSALMLAVLAALIPAWRAYRNSVPETLNGV